MEYEEQIKWEGFKKYTIRVYENGDEEWLWKNKIHRENGPAMTYRSHSNWCKNGRPHREDGPAIKYSSGKEEYWLNGYYFRTRAEWEAKLNEATHQGKIVEIGGKKYKLEEI